MILIIFLKSAVLYAQNADALQKRLTADRRVERVIIDKEKASPTMIRLASPIKGSDAKQLLKDLLATDPATDFKTANVQSDKAGIGVEKLQQYYKGIKVEHAVYSIITRNGSAEAFTGDYYALKNINTVADMKAAEALTYAKAFVGAEKYAWEQAKEAGDAESNPLKKQLYRAQYEKLLPKGELVIVKDYSQKNISDLAFKFDIYAADPLTRGYVFVNAHTGKIMLYDRIIKHLDPDQHNTKTLSGLVPEVAAVSAMNTDAPVQAADATLPPSSVLTPLTTRYAGTRMVGTKQVSGNDPSGNGLPLVSSTATPFVPGSAAYVLIDDTHHSQTEQTFDLNGVGGLPVSVPVYGQAKSFTDADNNWTVAEHVRGGQNNEAENDDYAFDAHWGATVVYDYWNNIHGRKSFDNKNSSIMSYVHYGAAYDNAFWNGSVMTYGDGSAQGGLQAGFAPLTSLDVCGHEIGHGICSYTADLVYQGESGAMNEGYSDVWAACIENYALQNIDPTLISNATTRPNGFVVWSIGEQIDANDLVSGSTGPNRPSSDPLSTALRYMDNPNKAGDPASYAEKPYSGTTSRWADPNCMAPNLVNDECGVHTNSGVLNHLMYLLTAGGSGNVNTVMASNASGAIDGQPFNVTGVGFGKSEQIMYLAEQMMAPGATFLDARNAGVLAAEILYGKCSFEWKQTILAWNGVAVGASSDTAVCSSLPLVTVAAEKTVNEAAARSAANCTDASTSIDFSVNVLPPGIANPLTVTVTPSGTATLNTDYTIQATTFNYSANATGLQKTTISVYNDAEIESDETIVLAVHATDGISYTKDTTITITIKDDDSAPIISNARVNLLSENFDATANGALPAGWSGYDKLGAASSIAWRTMPASSYPGFGTKAMAISLNAAAGVGVYTPAYDPSAAGNVVLRTPQINAASFSDLMLTFSYAAGGEVDAGPPVKPLDYGRLVYSYDNITYQPFQFNDKLYNLKPTVTKDTVKLPGFLANKKFYLGFEWYNDDNVAVPPGFIIDSVIVSGGRGKIEIQQGDGVSEKQFANKDIYYLSAQDGQLIAHISNNSTDLGCVNATVTRGGNSFNAASITTGSYVYQQANRVVQITPAVANSTSTYTLTLYATAAELTGMTPSSLKVIKVKDGVSLSGTIANTDAQVITPVFEDHSADGYYSFTGTYTGFSQFVLAIQSAVVAETLLDFSATARNNTFIQLAWSATNETTGSYSLERAEKGSSLFLPISTQAMTGATGTNQYVYNDYTAQHGVIYQYRLKSAEGSSIHYSEIKLASLSGIAHVEIAPNPSKGVFHLYVSGYTGYSRLLVYNSAGQQLISRKESLDGNRDITVDLTAQAAGIYTLKLQNGTGTTVFKLIIR